MLIFHLASVLYQSCAFMIACSAWHTAETGKSTKHHAQNQLSSNWEFSHFVSLSPSHLFVFFSCTLSLSLCLQSPAALDCLSALKSSLALLACQAADGTNGYLRSCAPLPPPPKLFLSLLSAPCSLLFLFIFPPVLRLFPLSPCCCRPSGLFSPPLLSSWGLVRIVLSRSSCCSDLVRDQSGVQVCVCHLVSTVPSSRGSWTNKHLEIWEALEQLNKNVYHTERDGAHCNTHTQSHRTQVLCWSYLWEHSIPSDY